MPVSTSEKVRAILKLTPQSQYGIECLATVQVIDDFEVDSTESIWYNEPADPGVESVILKLTPQSQYGIVPVHCPGDRRQF